MIMAIIMMMITMIMIVTTTERKESNKNVPKISERSWSHRG